MLTSCDLKGKRILFFSTFFFGYENFIKSTLEGMGAIVDSYNERPDETVITKTMIRINRDFIAKKVDSYHNKIFTATKHIQYDFVFFIRCEAFSRDSIALLRKYHPKAMFLSYFWDSTLNSRNIVRVYDLFDKSFSFDKNDCEKYGMQFLPLFYIDDYSKVNRPLEYMYKTLFIGTLHSDRYRTVKRIIESQCLANYNNFTWFYLSSKLLLYKMKLTDKSLRISNPKDVVYKKLSLTDILSLFEKSEIIIDIQHPNQTGLTMRTFEALGARRKLITTNLDIEHYDFYNPNNILVIDRMNVNVPMDFISSQYVDIDQNIYDSYSLSSWLRKIFIEN